MLVEVDNGSGQMVDELIVLVEQDGTLVGHHFWYAPLSGCDNRQPHGLCLNNGQSEGLVPYGRQYGNVGHFEIMRYGGVGDEAGEENAVLDGCCRLLELAGEGSFFVGVAIERTPYHQ